MYVKKNAYLTLLVKTKLALAAGVMEQNEPCGVLSPAS